MQNGASSSLYGTQDAQEKAGLSKNDTENAFSRFSRAAVSSAEAD